MPTTTNGKYPYVDPTDQVADYPTTSQTLANLLDPLPNRNAIINPRMEIAQRGTTFTNPASGTYTLDRWIFSHNGTGGTRTVKQINFNPSGSILGGMVPRNYLELAVAGAGSPAATSQTIGQRIEDVRTFAGEQITVSAWILAIAPTTSVTIRAVQNFGTGGSASVSTTIGTSTISGTWTRIVHTATLPSLSGKTVAGPNNDYLEIQFDIGSATGGISLWGVQVEQRSTATALERRPLQQELALCQRYYYRRVADDVYGALSAVGFATSANGGYVTFPFPTTMRAIPTPTGGGNVALSTYNANIAVTSFSFGSHRSTRDTGEVLVNVAGGLTSGAPYFLRANNDAAAWVAYSAEL